MSELQTEPTPDAPEPETPDVATPEPAPTPEPTPDAEPEPEPDAAPEPDAEPDVEPQPQSGATEQEWEARFKKAGQRFDTYQRAIFGIFEEAAHDLIQCPLCLQVPGFVDKNAAGLVPPEQADLVKHFLGISREIEYEQLPGFRACTTCKGKGKGKTGSEVPDQKTAVCPTCKGKGWEGPEAAPSNGQVEHAPTLVTAAVHSESGAGDDVDEWGEPRILPNGYDNPNFGRMPHRKVLVEPYGVTAGLTAQNAVTT